MATLPKFPTENESPQELRGYYIERDGEWVPDVPLNSGGNSALLQEREQRKRATEKVEELTKQMADFQRKFEGIDPDSARQAAEALELAEVERLEAEKKFQEAAELKYKNAINALEKKMTGFQSKAAKEEQERQLAEQKYSRLRVDQELGKSLLEMGADGEALDGLLTLTRDPWTWEDDPNQIGKGRLIMKDGDQIVMGSDPTQPISPKEYLQPRIKENTVLKRFFLSSGGGATDNGGLQRGNGVIISRTDAHDSRKWEAAREQARKLGVEVQIES